MNSLIDVNIMRRLVAGELTTTGADEDAWLALPRGFSEGALEAWPEFYGWTDAAVAHLNLLEEHERLTAELEEARLGFSANRGLSEGAPSEGWRFAFGAWRKELGHQPRRRLYVRDGAWAVQEGGLRGELWVWVTMRLATTNQPMEGQEDHDRAAMLAVEAAWSAATAFP